MYCPKCGRGLEDTAKFCPNCGTPAAPGASQAASASTGLPENLAGLFCYILGWLTGLVFFLIDRRSFVRFHAMQSIITFGCVTILNILISALSVIGFWSLFHLLNNIIMLIAMVAWVLCMLKAYQGQRYKLPFFGDLAERYAGTQTQVGQ
ncbi:MAG: zinc-ribbon domain-containing protein [Peptococcaceae bacterium]|jgi:uncharacterized membrane protein|nr:zinc-ribbon domain-containing protein [Peptococcaceae bacterium]MDH7523918.1 zinc-ribbon domain-containing protein [Peptococcaceae bacterium]